MGVDKKLATLAGKLDDTVRVKEEGDRNREKMRAEIINLNDALASLRYDLAAQRSRTQDTQCLLDQANVSLDEKDAKIHHITKERNDLTIESNALNKTIESLEGGYSLGCFDFYHK